MDWFLYDNVLCHERVNIFSCEEEDFGRFLNLHYWHRCHEKKKPIRGQGQG